MGLLSSEEWVFDDKKELLFVFCAVNGIAVIFL